MIRSFLIAIAFFPFLVHATDINCQGNITIVMDYPAKCNGNTAFKTTASNGSWLCPPSEKGNALVLTALAAGKEVSVYINSLDNSLTCLTLPHYVPARYILLRP